MAFSLGLRSKLALRGVHPDLVRVVELAITLTPTDFTVIEGLRTPERQKQLVASGASKTLNSLHIKQPDGFGHAVDVVPYIGGKISWRWNDFWPVVDAMQQAAMRLGIPLESGANWKSFPDGPHHQLARAHYGAGGNA